jgi:type IV secretory pathway VirB2 component (pilin)
MMAKLATIVAWSPPSASLSDSSTGSPLLAAVLWVQNLVVGPVATVVASIAVAAVGLMMFSGRLNLRRGGVVLSGCFILFGASTIAAGIRGAAIVGGLGPSEPLRQHPVAAEPMPLNVPPTAPPAKPRDPYAGASLPPR